jgi:hypothetical protein
MKFALSKAFKSIKFDFDIHLSSLRLISFLTKFSLSGILFCWVLFFKMNSEAFFPVGIISDPCKAMSPAVGTVCLGGTIFVGTLSPGATKGGTAIDRYMITPGGCGDIPVVDGGNNVKSSYTKSDFSVNCSGDDTLQKFWNDGLIYDLSSPTLKNYTGTVGIGKGDRNTDEAYGSSNTNILAGLTDVAKGGFHAAARYCDKLVYGGYSDWFLPNRYELNLVYSNLGKGLGGIGLDTASWYWSSTEYGNSNAWAQNFSNGDQQGIYKNNTKPAGTAVSVKIRCMRRF